MIRAVCAFLLALCAAGCAERAATPPSAPATPALWAIEDRDGSATGWLFGTIHALPDGAQWETPALTRVIDSADTLVVEVRDLDPKRTADTMARLASDNPGPPLADRLAASGRRRLADLLARENVPAARFDGLETWAAALAIARLGATAPIANGVDQALLRRFAGRPITELEGAAAQLAIFDRLTEREQRSLLGAILSERADPAADQSALAAAWLAGNLDQLERTTRRGLLADPALYGALSADRNRAWLARLIPLLESGKRPLVAVGTAHMLGEDGLPALLAEKGYRVRRIQ